MLVQRFSWRAKCALSMEYRLFFDFFDLLVRQEAHFFKNCGKCIDFGVLGAPRASKIQE